MSSLTSSQLHALQTTERVASCFSLLGASFIILTFSFSAEFRKPVNRLIFYASWGNLLGNAATLISRNGISSGQDSALCQFQAFLIQMFFLADALFNLAMAINVYLTLFKKYNAQQLKALEWRYLLLCYGAPFIIALVYCFVETQGRGKIYGPAQLWCWVSGGWAFLRLVTFYVPAWICIFVSFTLYILAGREIFHKREELRAFRQPSRASVEEPFSGSKTTEVCVTSEHATFHILNPPPNCFDAARPSADNPHLQSTASPNGYEQYSTTINSSPESTAFEPSHRTSQHSTSAYKRYRAALETNAAAWRYTKVALLFFVSLCVTWIPSSINRIYDLAHPDDVSYPLNFISAIVLPLMGFWNGVIYFATTRAVCNTLFWDLVERCAPKRKVSSARSPRSSRKLSEAKEGKRLQSGSVTDSLTGFVMDSKRGDNAV